MKIQNTDRVIFSIITYVNYVSGCFGYRLIWYTPRMKYFTVLYKMPVAGLEEWMKKPESERKDAESSLKGEWDAWVASHTKEVQNTIALGATKEVSPQGIRDIKNGLMLSSYVAAESAEAAAELFKNHPHLKIPGATIEVMEARQM